MEKVIKDGKVAVITSNVWGTGWSTWNGYNQTMMFHPLLVDMIKRKRVHEITSKWMHDNLGLKVFIGTEVSLTINWLPIGTEFTIMETDGMEHIITKNDLKLIA